MNNVYSMSTVLESEQYVDDCTHVLLEKIANASLNKEIMDIGEWIQWYGISPQFLWKEI